MEGINGVLHISVCHGMAESFDMTLISLTHSTSGSELDLFELVELRIALVSMLRSKAD